MKRISFWITESIHHIRHHCLSYLMLGLSGLAYFILCDLLFLSAYTGYQNYLQWHRNLVLEAFIESGQDSSGIEELIVWLKRHPMVNQVETISKEQAAARIEDQLGFRIADVLAINPLPASIRITIKPNLSDPDQLDSLLSHLYHYPGLQPDFQDFTLYARWYSIFRSAAMLLLILFGCLMMTFFLSQTALNHYILQKNQNSIRLLLQMGFRKTDLTIPYIVIAFSLTQIIGWIVFAGIIFINQSQSLLMVDQWFFVFTLAFSMLLSIFPVLASLRSFRP